MYSDEIHKNESYLSFDHVIVLVVCIIFFLVFVIQMTIFDYYKKPSIYEIELFNEFRRSTDDKKNCGDTSTKTVQCGCDTENSTSRHHDRSIYDSAMFYKDIIMIILYINILFVCSYYFSETMMSIIAIIILSALSYYKFHY